MRYPDGYWSEVGLRSFELMENTPNLDGETAYWLARQQVDKENMEKQRQIRLLDLAYGVEA